MAYNGVHLQTNKETDGRLQSVNILNIVVKDISLDRKRLPFKLTYR